MSSSPWGAVQDSRTIAPGIRSVSTAGHGGYLLNASRWEEFRLTFPTFKPWAGDGAFEEDCDWAAVAVAFPQHFDDSAIYNAVRTIDRSGPPPAGVVGGSDYMLELRDWLGSVASVSVRTRAYNYALSIAGRWEVGCYGSASTKLPGGKLPEAWFASFRNATTGEQRSVNVRGMPRQQFYTEAELSAVTLSDAVAA